MLHTLWNYRNFIAASIKREFQAKYNKSILGLAWVVMNPLYMTIIYTSIFASIMNQGDRKFSYAIYVACGLLAWNFFIDILNRSQNIYLNYSHIIKQQHFPLLCLPVVVTFIAWIDLLISFSLISVFLLIIGEFPGWCFMGLLPIILLQTAFAIGLGTGLGLLNIFFRDIEKALPILLQIWFWLTPIVYFTEKLSPAMQQLIAYNPLSALIHAYQTILVNQQWPDWSSLFFPLIVTFLLGGFFLRFYHQRAFEILDEL